MMKLIDKIQQLTEKDLKHKTIFQLLASTGEEFGELARALNVGTYGNEHKTIDEPAHMEAVDLAICSMMMYVATGGKVEDFEENCMKKLAKWEESQGPIDCFKGKFWFLSNFFTSELEYEGVTYPTVEHAYQAAKSLDQDIREEIAKLPTPGKAKQRGQGIGLRKDWEKIKIGIMTDLVRRKFARHDDLAKQLLDTGGRRLIEGNYWHDYFWGVCDSRGENHLGQILEKVREELRNV